MRIFLIVIAISLTGCAFEFDVYSQKTALEKQILGTYQDIEDDLILVSSVRGENEKQVKDAFSRERRKALDARLNQDFNRDDIDELKDRGFLGEAADGSIMILPDSIRRPMSSAEASFARALIEEENVDRHRIWREIIAANKNLTDQDLTVVRQTFARVQRENAGPGQYVQGVDGRWIKIPGA